MQGFIQRHSAALLMLAGVLGFMFPTASAALFPYLPYILFFLMLFTLLGMQQQALIKALQRPSVWIYALLHSAGLTLMSTAMATLLGASASLTLGIAGVAATGSLFATPAIARSVGLDPLKAMAMTIATTLIMPAVLYVNLLVFQDDHFTLNLQEYVLRLLIFIVGPMGISALVYRFTPSSTLQSIHQRLSSVTIVLVFAFPFGLIGPFRDTFNVSLSQAMLYLLLATALSLLFFLVGYLLYRSQSLNAGLLAAITSANRNVLLTYTVAGSYLGPDYLILLAAIQLPTYALPLLVRAISRHTQAKHNAVSS
ncbi:hypothetical protein ACFFLZ_06205 [Photobacterium aphoticum]|uniref:Membrane protein n=1 Tax=Photobacterium aphoticum TaxID=754436 RepID=A0A0J1JIV6_9GAMM|nr:hypothetical protein [Photobacterium aphoticum]KLV01962.1 membrane protein [Photobacterium aphoticum]PSU60208.1 hypothetical protein C9I90_00875 [Photobacterium aphoticum]GHA34070.1 hypothetical protein GCM10007086_04230 [Photobacterium aphoticum]